MPKSSPDSPPPSPPLIRYHAEGPVTTEYRVGLCAWQDKSMVEEGSFYPIKSMKAEERLWWYSRFFDCVEVNSTFYAPLSAQNAVLWSKRTPPMCRIADRTMRTKGSYPSALRAKGSSGQRPHF